MQSKKSLSIPQRKAFYYARGVDHPAFFLEMRLGKTRLTIRDFQVEKLEPVLIVAPYSALYGWSEELKLMGYHKNDINHILGTKAVREKRLSKLSPVNLINREAHLSCPNLGSFDWRGVVFDESTSIKAPPGMNWSEKFDKRPNISRFYTENFRHVCRRYILTGTPMPESQLDLFQQLKFLDPQIFAPYDNYYQFRNKLFVKTDFNDWIATQEGKEFIHQRLAQFCFFMTRKQAGIGGRKIYERRIFQLPKKVRKAYKTLAKDFILEYEKENNQDILRCTEHTVARWLWLRYLCSGFLAEERALVQIDKSKLDILRELLIGELKNSNVLIWCSYNNEISAVKKQLQKMKQPSFVITGKIPFNERDRRIRLFQDGKCKRLILQSKCFEEGGATMNRADCSIFFSSPLGLKSRLQNEDRMVDAYSDDPDLIIDLCAEDTIEEDIITSLVRKEARQDMMKRIVRRLQGVK